MKAGATMPPSSLVLQRPLGQIATNFLRKFGRLLRTDHHDHLTSLKAREGFDLACFRSGDIGGHTVQKLESQFLVGHLAAPETQGNLYLVTFAQEFQHRAHLHIIVMGIRSRTELDFLDFDDVLFLARFGLALLSFIFELAEVHDLADRRFGVRADLDQIKSGLFRHGQGTGRRHDADVFAVRTNQADFRAADPVVDARAGVTLRRGVVGSAGYGMRPYVVCSSGRKIVLPGFGFNVIQHA